jgi:CRISPR/Cas system-associated exonuclease Cas4 (RecB family)
VEAKISVSSTPANADIEIDGNFVGNTPSAIEAAPGEHTVVVKKSGYKQWQRKLKVTGGTINLSADLEKN